MKNRFLIIILVLSCIIIQFSKAEARDIEGPKFEKETGNFIYTTEDKKASTSITWGNVGFNISLKKTNGDPISDSKVATIYYDSVNADHEIKDNGNGTKTTKYWIKADYLRKKIDAKYGKGYYDNVLKDGQYIYFNNIFQVYHNGKAYGSKIHTLTGIKRAEYWGPDTMADFPFHFDRPVQLHKAPPEVLPAQVLYRAWINGKWVDLDGPKDLSKEKWGKLGGETYHTFALTKEYNGKKYRLYRSYYTTIKSGGNGKHYNDLMVKTPVVTLEEVQNQKGKILESGTLFVALMKTDAPVSPPEETEEEEETMEGIFMPPNPTGVIEADNRGGELFDVSEGIPTTEYLYTNVLSEEYLSGYVFKKKPVKKSYPVTVSRTYILNWSIPSPPTPEGIPMPPIPQSQTVTKNITIDVERKGSYWYIDNLDVYGVKEALVENYALPTGHIVLNPTGYNPPSVDYILETDHVKDPAKWDKTVSLGSITLNGGANCPSIDQGAFENDAKAKAEDSVGQLRVKNDYLKFNNDILMDNTYMDKKTNVPQELPECNANIGEDVLYKNMLVIDRNKHNGVEESRGYITYSPIVSVNSVLNTAQTYDIEGINTVTIHTPVVCDAQVENMNYVNQMIAPDIHYNSLVLDTAFNLNLPTVGEHKWITGYGYRDYMKYTADRQVQFPFDVYRTKGNVFIPKNTWFSIHESDITQFYLPIWVDEGKYTIQFRTISINAADNGGFDNGEPLLNESLISYTATDTINVEVSGRIYGMHLYDISDYPIWQPVFRKQDSLKPSGFNYTVGTKNRNASSNGQNPKFTLPLVKGSHPLYPEEGVIKTGYLTRFSLSTIGNMYGEKDYIKINPHFYYVSEDGKERISADVYYSETFGGKKNVMVKMGSELDSKNIKIIRTGEPYLAIPEPELITTARINGVSIMQQKELKKKVYTFTNIMLPDTLRTYIGTNFTPTGRVPSGVEADKVTKSMQNWYGEYYLPSEIHVVPEGFDVSAYVREHGGLNYHEPFWLKGGYILINFSIETVANEKRHLSYVNPINSIGGYCNMWKREGFQYEKTDVDGNTIHLQDGDFVLYDTNRSAALDYRSRGTH